MRKSLIQDSIYILFIGLSPLLCEYGKTQVDKSLFARQIKNQILMKHKICLSSSFNDQKQKDNQNQNFISINDVQIAIQQSDSHSKLTQQEKNKLLIIKKWMGHSFNFYDSAVKKNIVISLLHVLGGLVSPNIFFISIVGYFSIYQVSFLSELLTIKNGRLFKNNFTFDILNTFYLYVVGVTMGLVGARTGIQKISNKMIK